jgi:hypothetical protein
MQKINMFRRLHWTIFPVFSLGDWGESWKISVFIAGVEADIWTQDLRNWKEYCYQLDNDRLKSHVMLDNIVHNSGNISHASEQMGGQSTQISLLCFFHIWNAPKIVRSSDTAASPLQTNWDPFNSNLFSFFVGKFWFFRINSYCPRYDIREL